ncbi:hypothetical protein ACVXHB_24755 [Escherichia coli]
MLISAFALKAYRGYIFLRGEYIEAAVNLRRAIAEATEAGLLGKNIMGNRFRFRTVRPYRAGRYICGEETALINSLEGRARPTLEATLPGNLRRMGNRPVTTSKPCVTFRRSSLTAWSGIRTSRRAKTLAPS